MNTRPNAKHLQDRETGNVVPPLFDARAIPGLQRRQKLSDLYLFIVDACVRGGLSDWWRHAANLPFDDLAEGAKQLKELCLHELLVDAGDIATFGHIYEILEAEGYLTGDERGLFLLELMRFLRPRLKDPRPRPKRRFPWKFSRRRQAVVSVVVPDDRSLKVLFDWCLPTLESDDALEWFTRRRTVTLLLAVGAKRIVEVEERLKAKRLAWRVVCQPLPETLCDGSVLEDVRREWLAGAIQYQHLTEAAALGAEFYSINPNGIYAAGYFKELMRVAEGQPAVLSALLWASNQGLLERITTGDGREGTPRTVSALDLANLGRDVCATAPCTTFVEGFGHIRGQTSHLRVTWASRDRLDIHSTCHEILYMSQQTLRDMPQRFSIRPGADIERIVGDRAEPYFVAEEDGIVVAELGHPPGSFGDVAGDPARFEAVTGPLALKRPRYLFRRPVRLRTTGDDEAARPDPGDALVKALKDALVQAIDGDIGASPNVAQLLRALIVVHQYEMSEYGLENMAGAIAEGRRLIDLYPLGGPPLEKAERRALIRAALNFDHVDRAIALAGEGGEETSFIHEFLSKMAELRASNVEQARQLRRRSLFPQRYAVLASIVWGESYVDKFMNYNVASLLVKENIPTLRRHCQIVHSIVTTDADRERIVAHPAFKQLSRYAHVVFTCFPESFIAKREQDQYPFYQFYGLLDHQSVFLAAALRADLYLMPIDIVISRGGLANLERRLHRGADGCSVAGIECEPDLLRAWLDGRPRGPVGELDLPAEELMDAAISMPDAYARSLVMNPDNRAFCAHPRELVWPHSDGLSVHSIYMHPLAVSSRLMSRPFSPHYENVDYALLPRLLQGDGELEVLENAAEFVIAQFGAPAAREEFRDGGFSIEAFMDAHRYDYAVHRRCFATRQRFACASPPFAPSDSHDRDVGLIRAALKRYKFTQTGEEGL